MIALKLFPFQFFDHHLAFFTLLKNKLTLLNVLTRTQDEIAIRIFEWGVDKNYFRFY